MDIIREEDITIIPVITEEPFDYSEIFDIGRFPIPAEIYEHIMIMAPINDINYDYSPEQKMIDGLIFDYHAIKFNFDVILKKKIYDKFSNFRYF